MFRRFRSQRNIKSKECKDNPAAREEVKAIKVELGEKEDKMKTLKAQVDEKMAWLPNFISDDSPAGGSDEDNEEIKVVGEKPVFDFEPKDHQELGEILDIIDTARGAKVAQAGFYYWKGKGAVLAQSLFFWTQMELVKKRLHALHESLRSQRSHIVRHRLSAVFCGSDLQAGW